MSNARARLNECHAPGVHPIAWSYTACDDGTWEACAVLANGHTYRGSGLRKDQAKETTAQRILEPIALRGATYYTHAAAWARDTPVKPSLLGLDDEDSSSDGEKDKHHTEPHGPARAWLPVRRPHEEEEEEEVYFRNVAEDPPPVILIQGVEVEGPVWGAVCMARARGVFATGVHWYATPEAASQAVIDLFNEEVNKSEH